MGVWPGVGAVITMHEAERNYTSRCAESAAACVPFGIPLPCRATETQAWYQLAKVMAVELCGVMQAGLKRL